MKTEVKVEFGVLFTLIIALFGCLFVPSGQAQEVIMNQPSADIVDKGKVFVRADEFYTQHPAFYAENLNLAYGLFKNFEVSLNNTNAFNRAPAPDSLVFGFKYAPVKTKHFELFVGDQLNQPLTHTTVKIPVIIETRRYDRHHDEDSDDLYTFLNNIVAATGNLSYEAMAFSYGNWRFTAGSFQSHNVVQLGNRAGVIGGVEWTAKKFHNGWSLVPGIDYASGAGSNGYTSPGLTFVKGNFFVCPGYMVGNPHNTNGAHQSFVMIGTTF